MGIDTSSVTFYVQDVSYHMLHWRIERVGKCAVPVPFRSKQGVEKVESYGNT